MSGVGWKKGEPRSPETRAKMAEAKRRNWAEAKAAREEVEWLRAKVAEQEAEIAELRGRGRER